MGKISLKCHENQATETEFDKSRHAIIVIPEKKWPSFPYQSVLKKRRERQGNGDDILVTDLPNNTSTCVSLTSINPEQTTYELLGLARQLIAPHMKLAPKAVSLHLVGLEQAQGRSVAEALLAALLAASAELPSYKSTRTDKPSLARVHCYGLPGKLDLNEIEATAAGNNLARALTMLPPNTLTPKHYRQRLLELAKENKWTAKFHDVATLRRLKAGAFLAVAQGSADQDAGILRLGYKPARSRGRLALVGKGICFDTGGMNLKPAKHMHGMHEDMQGSAVAVGTLLALSRLEFPYQVDCWLAISENHIGPQAYKQNDVVTACNGTTIEIMHTDAEGRMVLADTLSLAARNKPALIIDYATLTGTCIYALGTAYSGAFTNRDDLISLLIAAGQRSGERCWPFPIDKDYDRELESSIADIKQCSLAGEADHILAARFLSRFVDDIPWLHLDLAAANHKGGLAHIGTDITGFGVRYTLDLLTRGHVIEKVS